MKLQKWSFYVKDIQDDFSFSLQELTDFFNTQEKIWSDDYAKEFLNLEYGKNWPKESPLIILPSNTPHLFLQELQLCSVAKWTPTFYVSKDLVKTKNLLQKKLKQKVISIIPQEFFHVRSYGKNKLPLKATHHLFHGPWAIGSNVDLLTKKEISQFNELEGRGCLAPLLITGDKNLLKELPSRLSKHQEQNTFHDYFMKSLMVAHEIKELKIKKNLRCYEIKSASLAYRLALENPPVAQGTYFILASKEYKKLKQFPLLQSLEKMKRPLRTLEAYN